METSTALPARKVYSERSVLIGTFLGGPIVAGYLMTQNFKALGVPQKIRPTWLFVILAIILVIPTVYIPFLEQLPNAVYSFAFCMIAHALTKKHQGVQIQEHLQNGGALYPTWRGAVAGLLCLLVFLAIVLGLMALGTLA